jgi:hypothetical protein
MKKVTKEASATVDMGARTRGACPQTLAVETARSHVGQQKSTNPAVRATQPLRMESVRVQQET